MQWKKFVNDVVRKFDWMLIYGGVDEWGKNIFLDENELVIDHLEIKNN